MPISINYTVTDEPAEDNIPPINITVQHDNDQDAEVMTLHQDGSEVSMTLEMARNLVAVIGKYTQ